MADIDEAVRDIAALTDRREALRAELAELNERRAPAAGAVAKAAEALATATAQLAATDSEIAEARAPIVAELEEMRADLRVASALHQDLVLVEQAEPSEPGDVIAVPGIESEEALGKI